MTILDLPHIRHAARAWMRAFKIRTVDCEEMLLTYAPSDGVAFDVPAILIEYPQADPIMSEKLDNASWRVFFLKEDLAEIGLMTRDPDNRDRITVDGTVFLPGVVNARSNGTVECYLMQPDPGT